MSHVTRRVFLSAAAGLLACLGSVRAASATKGQRVAMAGRMLTGCGEATVPPKTEEEQHAADLDYLKAWCARTDRLLSGEPNVPDLDVHYDSHVLDHLVADLRNGRWQRVCRLMTELYENRRHPGMSRITVFDFGSLDANHEIRDGKPVPVYRDNIPYEDVFTPRVTLVPSQLTSNLLTAVIGQLPFDMAQEFRYKLDRTRAEVGGTIAAWKGFDTEPAINVQLEKGTWFDGEFTICMYNRQAGRVYLEDDLDYIHADLPIGTLPLTIHRIPKNPRAS